MVKEWSFDINTIKCEIKPHRVYPVAQRTSFNSSEVSLHTHSENISCLVDLTEYHNLRKDENTSLTLHSYTGSVEIFLYFPIIISNLKSTYTFLPYDEGVIILKKKKRENSLRVAR